MASSVESLSISYHLTEEDVDKQITDKHIEVISRFRCRKWRFLYAHLDLASIGVEDIDHMQVDEDQKRSLFFTNWKEKKGSEATYKRLISALLTMECREDAESVCDLLKQQQQQQNQQQRQQQEPGDSYLLIPHVKVIFHLCLIPGLPDKQQHILPESEVRQGHVRNERQDSSSDTSYNMEKQEPLKQETGKGKEKLKKNQFNEGIRLAAVTTPPQPVLYS